MYRCPLCLVDNVFGLRYNKDNIPFFLCQCCGKKIKTDSAISIGSVILWVKSINTIPNDYIDAARREAARIAMTDNLRKKITVDDLNIAELEIEPDETQTHHVRQDKRDWD